MSAVLGCSDAGVDVRSVTGGISARVLPEGFRGDMRSELRGGTTGSLSLVRIELSGAGTKPSSLAPCGRVGSMGGRFLSGGFSSVAGVSANPKAPVPLTGPFLDLGGRLLASSLRMVDAATESWLLLLPASRRSAAWLADRLESILPEGDPGALGGANGPRGAARGSGVILGAP